VPRLSSVATLAVGMNSFETGAVMVVRADSPEPMVYEMTSKVWRRFESELGRPCTA
jgi:hypothetical protein